MKWVRSNCLVQEKVLSEGFRSEKTLLSIDLFKGFISL